MCSIVGAAVAREEKRRDIGATGVVKGSGVVLEKVEQGKGREEEWGSPDLMHRVRRSMDIVNVEKRQGQDGQCGRYGDAKRHPQKTRPE